MNNIPNTIVVCGIAVLILLQTTRCVMNTVTQKRDGWKLSVALDIFIVIADALTAVSLLG